MCQWLSLVVLLLSSPRLTLSFSSTTIFGAQQRRQVASNAMAGADVTKTSEGRYKVSIDGPRSGIGSFGKAIYDKILTDQKEMHKTHPVPGFKPGTIPPFVMSRIKFAAVREICRETCLAALQENDIQPVGNQDEIVLMFPEHAEDGDIPTFVKSSGWRPGNEMSFTAEGVKGVSASVGNLFSDREVRVGKLIPGSNA
jgi:hypothetical protein